MAYKELLQKGIDFFVEMLFNRISGIYYIYLCTCYFTALKRNDVKREKLGRTPL